MKMITIPAHRLQPGMTLAFYNSRFNYLIDDVESCKDGRIKVYGGNFTKTEWFDANQNVWVEVSE